MNENRSRLPTWKVWLFRILLLGIIGGAIYVSPQGVAIVVASLAIVVIGLVWYIKYKIKKFVEPFKNLELFPSSIQLTPTAIDQWYKPEQVAEDTKAFKSLGFEHAGDYTADKMAGANLRGFAHVEKGIYALIYDLEYLDNYVDMVTAYEDGSYATYSSTPMSEILERPPTHPIERFPGVGIESLFAKLIDGRPAKAMRTVTKEGLPSAVAQYIAEEFRWREENTARQQRLREQIEETFLEQMGWSAVEWNRKKERVIFVHDQLRKTEVVELFVEYLFVDDDDVQDKIQAKANDIIAKATPRRSFAAMIELAPSGQRFEKLTTINVEFEVDAYLASERPDDWDDD